MEECVSKKCTPSRASWLRRALAGTAFASVLVLVLLFVSLPTGRGGWSQPNRVQGAGALSAVSCPTVAFCVAVGGEDAATYYRGHWSKAVVIDTHRGSGSGLDTVSCSSPTFCIAGDDAGDAFTFDGFKWSNAVLADGEAGFSQISCVASGSCMAVDDDGNFTYLHGGGWSRPVPIPGSSQPLSIACTRSLVCMAVDGNATGAYRFRRGRWSDAGQLPVLTPQGGSATPVGSSVSCATSELCAALDDFGEAFIWQGKRWSDAVRFDTGLADASDAVSCPSSKFCMVVDEDGVATRWNGSTWSSATQVDAADASLADVSCASSRFCVAVDGYGRALTYR